MSSQPQFATPNDFRMTKQRKVVHEVLLGAHRDHPTAGQVFERAKEKMPSISLATVYNCLEALTQVGVVKQVNVDREASRYCPNQRPHAHFFCSSCQEVFDINLRPDANAVTPWALPKGATVDHIEVAMKGTCPKCGVSNPEILTS